MAQKNSFLDHLVAASLNNPPTKDGQIDDRNTEALPDGTQSNEEEEEEDGSEEDYNIKIVLRGEVSNSTKL